MELRGHWNTNMTDMGAWDYFNSGNGSYDVLAKNVADFYPSLISLLEVQVKGFTLFGLTK